MCNSAPHSLASFMADASASRAVEEASAPTTIFLNTGPPPAPHGPVNVDGVEIVSAGSGPEIGRRCRQRGAGLGDGPVDRGDVTGGQHVDGQPTVLQLDDLPTLV